MSNLALLDPSHDFAVPDRVACSFLNEYETTCCALDEQV